MKELKIVDGGRRWHGNEFVDMQAEWLDALQGFFGLAGSPCIISGCEIIFVSPTSSTGGNFSIAPGIVGMHYKQGDDLIYKLIRFAGASATFGINHDIPKYLVISKIDHTKDYGTPIAPVQKIASSEYVAILTDTQPTDGEYIKLLPPPSVGYPTMPAPIFASGIGKNTKMPWVTTSASTSTDIDPFKAGTQLQYRYLPLINSLQIRGIAKIRGDFDMGQSPLSLSSVTAYIPANLRPVNNFVFTGVVPTKVLAADNINYVASISGSISNDIGDIAFHFLPVATSVSTYAVSFDTIMPLD